MLLAQPNCKVRQFKFRYSKPALSRNWGELEVNIPITVCRLKVGTEDVIVGLQKCEQILWLLKYNSLKADAVA